MFDQPILQQKLSATASFPVGKKTKSRSPGESNEIFPRNEVINGRLSTPTARSRLKYIGIYEMIYTLSGRSEK